MPVLTEVMIEEEAFLDRDLKIGIKELPSNRVKFNPAEGKVQKTYRQIKGEDRICQKINFHSKTEQIQADYLDRYEGAQAQIHWVSQFDDTSAVSITYFSRVERSRRDNGYLTR